MNDVSKEYSENSTNVDESHKTLNINWYWIVHHDLLLQRNTEPCHGFKLNCVVIYSKGFIDYYENYEIGISKMLNWLWILKNL